jgi:hypothetical protein
MQAAETRKVSASSQKAHSIGNCEAISPAAAKPIAVEPKSAIERNEFAAASSSSDATSGITASWAGSKNCLTPAFISTIT